MADYNVITEQKAWKQANEERKLEAFKQVCTPLRFKWLAFTLVCSMVIGTLALAFVPWQQTVNGLGEVTVLSPMDRPQELKSSIPARISRWLVKEGDWVKAGQTLLELDEIKIEYLDASLTERLEQKRLAYLAKQQALQAQQGAMSSELAAVQSGQSFAVPAAQAKQAEVGQKLEANQRKVEGALQAWKTAQQNLIRREQLWKEGLRSRRDYELAQETEAKELANLQAARADVQAVMQSSAVAGFEVGKTATDFAVKQAEIASKMAKNNQELATLQSDLQDLDIKLANQKARTEQRLVKAPVSGRLVRAEAVGPGVTVKEGDALGLIMPASKDRIAALYVSDFNAPLLKVGQQVRLQFSGWPALQFSGFPNVALGTFAGTIKVVDAVSDTSNQFRVLVEPDLKGITQRKEQNWPEAELLRPGTQASGWIMLDTVPLGYELWRRFNGFPPSLREKSKPDKLKAGGIKSHAIKGAK